MSGIELATGNFSRRAEQPVLVSDHIVILSTNAIQERDDRLHVRQECIDSGLRKRDSLAFCC